MKPPNLPHWPIHTGRASADSVGLMLRVLELLGNPQNKLRNVIHVGGTNGKGSTIAFTASILRNGGKSVNVYTSPHILDFCERFNLNGKNASKEQVFFAFEEVRAVCERHNILPTILEASTLACFVLFAKIPADYNIVEVCMGGRLDCTNVGYKNLICTAIASISKDHMKYLGTTIPEIALHKAGIQREGVLSVIAKQKEPKANLLFLNYAKKFNIPASFYGGDYNIYTLESENRVPSDVKILYKDQKWELYLPMPSLRGVHQLENLATSLRVCSVIGFDLQNASNAITKTEWIGRLQRVYNNYFPKNAEFWFDGAHNQGGASVLKDWILETQKQDIQDYVIVGKSKGADQVGFLSAFKNTNIIPIFVTVKGEIFPETSSNLFEIARLIGVDGVDGKSVANAIANILPQDQIIRVVGCGSLYLLKDLTYYTLP